MPIKDLKKWLETPCKETDLRYMDTEKKKGAYIPIGIIEEMLDEFDSWSTQDFKFTMMRVDKTWVASGSVELIVYHEEKMIRRNGAQTFPIGSKLDNDDFESTCLSLCIANAAKKLGKRFGRHLNGRLERGETVPVIDLEEQRKLDLSIDAINDAKAECEILELWDMHPEYHKNREYVVAVSNAKHILKIKNKTDGSEQLPNT